MVSSSNPLGSDQQQPHTVAWPEVVRFVRQLSHDLRNGLNSLELQLTLINEMAENSDLKADVARSREMVADMAGTLQKLTSTLVPSSTHPMPYRAADLVEDLRKRIDSDFPEQASRLEWDVQLGDEHLQIDPIQLPKALLALIDNAFQFTPAESTIAAQVKVEGGEFVWELREPKENFDLATDDWGGEPLRGLGRGHYGLGLYHARILIEAQEGKLNARFDPKSSSLFTTVTLPLPTPA